MDELELVKQLLDDHQGKGNAISAGEIEQTLGYPTEATHAKANLCSRTQKIKKREILMEINYKEWNK